MMSGARAAVVDNEVEAVSEDGKAKQDREPGFLRRGATVRLWMACTGTVT